MELKILILNLAPPIFLVGLVLFSRFVSRRLSAERVFGWRLFCIGGFAAIGGLAIAVYFVRVEVGATVVMIGVVISAIGFGKFFLPRR